LERAFEVAAKQRSNSLLVGQDGLMQANGKYLVDLAAKYRMPAIYPSNEYIVDGGLIGYGVSYPDLYRRAASHVAKIMNGSKPGDLPVEQPTKFELVINLKTAKALGIKIPNSILVRADKVIE
jgi:putative ABC transport system substrate-binding protein